jgi:hypothetical protein
VVTCGHTWNGNDAAVMSRLEELTQLAGAIENALEAEMGNRPATDAELKELFGDGFDESYAAEAEQRWGDTDAWAQSRARTSGYTKADWAGGQGRDGCRECGLRRGALTAGEPADSEAAMAAAEAHRRSIHDRFYDVSYAMHRGLGDMYVADPRFTKTYDDLAPGLAAYVRDAIHANARPPRSGSSGPLSECPLDDLSVRVTFRRGTTGRAVARAAMPSPRPVSPGRPSSCR